MNFLSKEILTRAVLRYFPVGLEDTYGTAYEESAEFKSLKEICSYFQANSVLWKNLLNGVAQEFPEHSIKDVSLLSWLDRCYTLDVLIRKPDNVVRVLSVSVSILLPFYLVTYIENDTAIGGIRCPYTTHDLSNENLSEEHDRIKKVMTSEGYSAFPVQFLYQVIPGVSFRTIKEGSFTFFNAFFLDEIVNRV